MLSKIDNQELEVEVDSRGAQLQKIILKKEGINQLKPGGEFNCTHTITIK